MISPTRDLESQQHANLIFLSALKTKFQFPLQRRKTLLHDLAANPNQSCSLSIAYRTILTTMKISERSSVTEPANNVLGQRYIKIEGWK